MITNLILNIIVLFIGAIFSWLPQVTTLPLINGYDIDSALVTGVGQLRAFTNTFWPLWIVFQGFLALFVYYILKASVKFFLGHRTPGH